MNATALRPSSRHHSESVCAAVPSAAKNEDFPCFVPRLACTEPGQLITRSPDEGPTGECAGSIRSVIVKRHHRAPITRLHGLEQRGCNEHRNVLDDVIVVRQVSNL